MFKNFIRKILANVAAFYLVDLILEGFIVEKTIETIFGAALVLTLVDYFIKPLIKIISFPINFITLGFFGLLINSILLYITVLLVDQIKLTDGRFKFDVMDFRLTEIYFSPILTLIVAATIISIINYLIRKILL